MNEYEKKRVEQREDSYNRIIEAAIICFGKNGYANTSIKEIAEEADVSHGLVCKYFDTKDNLLSEAYIHATTYAYSSNIEGTELKKKIETLILQTMELMKTKPEYFDFFMMLIHTSDIPEEFTSTRREVFMHMPICQSLNCWKEERKVNEGEPYDYFMLFMHTIYTLLNFYRKLSRLKVDDQLNAHVMLTYIIENIEKGINDYQ